MSAPRPDGTPEGPLYQVGAVAQLVGLAPATLRAWERRYGIPGPSRGNQGYRLYSEADVRTVRWLKSQVEAGLTVGRAAARLAQLRAQGRDPTEPTLAALDRLQTTPAAVTLADLADQCGQAIRRLDETAVRGVFRTAYAFYAFEEVMTALMQPVLAGIGEDWAAGRLPVAVEHFGSQQVLRQLWAMLTAAAPPWRPGTIVAGCAPGERHEFGLLMVVVRLRWRGWDVQYLGPELSLERLDEALRQLQPRLLLFSATRPDTAQHLLGLVSTLAALSDAPPVLFGGQAFVEDPSLPRWPGVHIHAGHEDVVAVVERLMVN